MGIVGTEEMKRVEMEELRRMLVSCAGLNYVKDQQGEEEEEFKDVPFSGKPNRNLEKMNEIVCVTSGLSYLGLAIVGQLLLRGYSVRIIVDNPEEEEKIREMRRRSRSMNNSNKEVSVVTAKLTEFDDNLLDAFKGCGGVFHTSSFIDPLGLSGYSKSMVEVEKKSSENVMEACARAGSVTNCVFTSSLLACIWRHVDSPQLIDDNTWSHDSLCYHKKLWFALGKMKAEREAWRVAKERGLKLASICPALITGPLFSLSNPTPTFAYLKGAREMYENGVLATVDVQRLAEAHVCVFEAMKDDSSNAFSSNVNGRFLCFDRIIKTQDEVQKLADEMGFSASKIISDEEEASLSLFQFQLSNTKLSNLIISRRMNIPRCYDECHESD